MAILLQGPEEGTVDKDDAISAMDKLNAFLEMKKSSESSDNVQTGSQNEKMAGQ
jgi:hypothetical protein